MNQEVSGCVRTARHSGTCRTPTLMTVKNFTGDTVTHSHLPRLAVECPFINLAKIARRYSRKISYCNRISPPARPFRAPVSPFTNWYPMRLMSCSILGLGSGFVIKSVGFTLVPTFFVTNLPDLDTSCIHEIRMTSTCLFRVVKDRKKVLGHARHVHTCLVSKSRFSL